MLNGCTFADVCAFVQRGDDPEVLDVLDKLTGLTILSAAGHAALAATTGLDPIGILGLLSAKDEIFRTTKHLIKKLSTNDGPEASMQKYDRMEKAYCLICHTAFFELHRIPCAAALRRTRPESDRG